MNSIQIQALVRQMDESLRRHKGLKKTNKAIFRQKVVEENKLLYDSYPAIFEMHFEGKLDSRFFEMLKLKRQVELGNMTQDQADRLVGQQLFDHYVGPVVGNGPPPTNPMSYEDFYKQFNNN